MTCDACAEAEQNPRTSRFHAGCRCCGARALAQGPQHFTARSSRTMTPAYRDALQALFGADWVDGHAHVKAWAERMK